MTEKPRRPGAPPKENPASARCEFRCTPEQKRRWQAAADRDEYPSLAAWLKALADKNA